MWEQVQILTESEKDLEPFAKLVGTASIEPVPDPKESEQKLTCC